MKKLNAILITLLIMSIYCCNNTTDTGNSKTNNSSDVEKTRTAYLNKKEWVAPEDIDLIEDGFTPINERGLWDENKRKQAFIDKLSKLSVSDSTIQRLVIEVEQIIGGRTGQWNYEYIQSRFEVYKSEMAKDEEWKKIENEYQLKTKVEMVK